MLLEKELSPASCRPERKTLHCIARLDQDVGPVVEYQITLRKIQ